MATALAGPLDGVRVLDLTTERGQYAGKLLADLGADVLKVEPPEGDPARRIGPFFHDDVGPENSLSYWYFNTNKRSVTCNLDHLDGRDLFLRLVRTADLVLESFDPGVMDRRGVGYTALRAVKPDLVYVSISGFGLSGPHRDWKAPDIVGQAMGGVLTLSGSPEDPPGVLAGTQGYICASVAGAVGAMMALFHKERTGEGQLVEASMQEALSLAQETAMPMWDFTKIARERQGEWMSLPGRRSYRTQDGWIYCMAGQPDSPSSIQNLIGWMQERGLAEDLATDANVAEFFGKLDMRALTALMQDPTALQAVGPMLQHADAVIDRFFRTLTTREAQREGQRRRLLVSMIASPHEVMEDEHLFLREWYRTVEQHGEPVRYPGMPYRFSGTPLGLRRTAPARGEHNAEIWRDEAGIAPALLAVYAAEGVI